MFRDEVEALRAVPQYEGRQLIRSEFTSFDLQSETVAVVTTRETWEDNRYDGEYPDEGVPSVAHRGPYTDYRLLHAGARCGWRAGILAGDQLLVY